MVNDIKILVIGHDDEVSQNIQECLVSDYKGILLSPSDLIEGSGRKYINKCDLILVNLFSVSASNEELLLPLLKVSKIPLVAIHVYMIPSMIKSIMSRGYSNYISLFEFNDNLHDIVNNVAVSANNLNQTM